MIFVALGLGSNREFLTNENNYNKDLVIDSHVKSLKPIEILQKACIDLHKLLENSIISSVYTSKAMYVQDQSDFFNMIVCGYTDLLPEELLVKTQSIERKYGRNRNNEYPNGPRTLDIDIELYGKKQIHTNDLDIPHLRLSERQFVLIPLIEILQKCSEKLQKEDIYADIPSREKYIKMLKLLDNQGVKKYSSPFCL